MQRVISYRVWLSLIVYSSKSQKKRFQIPCIFLSFKENVIWTRACAIGPLMSSTVVFIFICQKSSHRFALIFFSVIEDIIHIDTGCYRALGSIFVQLDLLQITFSNYYLYIKSSIKTARSRGLNCWLKLSPVILSHTVVIFSFHFSKTFLIMEKGRNFELLTDR